MKLLIIGNGFDIDLGLNISYVDFYNYSIFSKIESTVPNSLEAFLKEKGDVVIRWTELEESMAEYVKNKKGELYETILECDKFFLKRLKCEFSDYIIRKWANKANELYTKPIKKSLAKQLITIQNKTHCFDAIYSFNCLPYIDLDLASDTEIDSLHDVRNVHGAGEEFIFGIRKDDCTREEYLFLVKENQENYPFEIADSLRKELILANNVVIFGHSLNRIDMGYFQEFFKQCLIDHRFKREITIITRDSNAVRNIKDNISIYAFPFEKLEASCKISFVLTDDYDNKVNMNKVERMFKRLSKDL